MNLHNIASGYISAVNPWIAGTYKQSTGYTTLDDGSRVPTYATTSVQIQMQALTYRDLTQISGLNINGEARAMYCTGDFEGVNRSVNRGGDVIILPDSSVWLIVHVLENWSTTSGWTKFAVVRQDGA